MFCLVAILLHISAAVSCLIDDVCCICRTIQKQDETKFTVVINSMQQMLSDVLDI